MTSRIVLFGATGYTGELTARAMLRRGLRPVLAGRSRERVSALAAELGDLGWAVADVERPQTVRDLLGPGDVLVSTVGPFIRWGEAAVQAAISAGAHYLDSTGEPPFVHRVFTEWGPRAADHDSALLTAMGYDYVPGNLAGGLALRDAGDAAARVDVGYFITGQAGPSAVSSGTRASAAGIAVQPGFAWRRGAIVRERGAVRSKTFVVQGRRRAGVSIGGTEHFTLPRLCPGLDDVDVYLGWFGQASPVVRGLSLALGAVTAVPGAATALSAGLSRALPGSPGGPDADVRARTRSLAVAEVRDADGRPVARACVEGPNAYDLTADLLAWGAQRAAAGTLVGYGALGPVDGFGLDALADGARELGLVRVTC